MSHAAKSSVLLLSVALVLAGCASDHREERRAEMEQAAVAIPEMEASGTFFAGQIGVEVVLNRVGFRNTGAGGEERSAGGGEGRGGRGSFRGGFGGGHRRGGGGGGREGGEARPGGDDEPRAHVVASNQPPVRLHLRLTNHGTAPVDVEVTDFESDLGNFVVQPAKITLAPNASAEADPMTSRLGVAATILPLTIELRANGHAESQTLSLHVKPTPAPATPAAPAPQA